MAGAQFSLEGLMALASALDSREAATGRVNVEGATALGLLLAKNESLRLFPPGSKPIDGDRCTSQCVKDALELQRRETIKVLLEIWRARAALVSSIDEDAQDESAAEATERAIEYYRKRDVNR